MNKKVGSVRNIKTINALRGEKLVIDLGKEFSGGTLTSWMKKDPNNITYRSFSVDGNRYLVLTQEKTKDYYNEQNELVEAIAGKWYFDVEFLKDGDDATLVKTIYQGTINFVNDITGSPGYEITGEGTSFPEYTLSELEDEKFDLLKNGDIVSTISLSEYAKANQLFSGDYNDLSNKPTILEEEDVQNIMSNYGYKEEEIEAPKEFIDNRTENSPFYQEDFSTDLGNFTTSGDAIWTRVTNEGNGDNFSAKSGNINDNESTILQIDITATEEWTKVKFDYKTDTETNFDFLEVNVDNVIERFSGSVDWLTEYFYIKGIGSHTIKFRYAKDGATSSGLDSVWLDNFKLINEVPPFVFREDVVFENKIVSNNRLIAKNGIYNHGNFFHSGAYFRIQNKEVSQKYTSFINESFGNVVSSENGNGTQAWVLANDSSANYFWLKRRDNGEGIKIVFEDSSFPDGYMQMVNSNFRFRLGATAVQETNYPFYINTKSLFGELVKVKNAIESEGETSNTETLASGIYNVDWSKEGNHDITLTQNTTITQSNIPGVNISKTITIYVKGDFALTLPTQWVIKNGGTYDGIKGSQIVIQSWDNGKYYTAINNEQ